MVPEEVFDVIKEQLIANKLIRRDGEWYYDFTIDVNGKIELRQTIKNNIKNMGREEVKKQFQAKYKATQGTEVGLEKLVGELNKQIVIIL